MNKHFEKYDAGHMSIKISEDDLNKLCDIYDITHLESDVIYSIALNEFYRKYKIEEIKETRAALPGDGG